MPCNVVTKPGATVMVLVQNANQAGRVRSHFERVVPSETETLQESGPRSWNAGVSMKDEFVGKPWPTDGEVEMEQAVAAVLRVRRRQRREKYLERTAELCHGNRRCGLCNQPRSAQCSSYGVCKKQHHGRRCSVPGHARLAHLLSAIGGAL